MTPKDIEKSTFITPWGTFCYRAMPFGLKNVGAMYHRAMTIIFHDMMRKEIEIYVGDMFAKTKTEYDHEEYLLQLFKCLRKYRLRLNPNKYTLGVRSRKLLGLIVDQKSIYMDLDKVRAIRECMHLE